jgi:hypothetical protein
MDDLRENSRIDGDRVRYYLENGSPSDVLRRMDYELWEADEDVDMEIARETYGWLATLDDVEPERDFGHIDLYVSRELEDLAESVPDSYFEELYDGTNHSTYRITTEDGFEIDMFFDMTHGDRVEIPTFHDRITVYAPTVDSYVRHSEDDLDIDLGEQP